MPENFTAIFQNIDNSRNSGYLRSPLSAVNGRTALMMADHESEVNNVDWTEDDEIRYVAERREQKRKIIQKMLDEAQRRYDEAERNYQDTGSASTMRTMHRNEDMMMICNLALQALDNVCGRCENRRRIARCTANKYKEAKESGNNDALNFENIIADFIDLQY